MSHLRLPNNASRFSLSRPQASPYKALIFNPTGSTHQDSINVLFKFIQLKQALPAISQYYVRNPRQGEERTPLVSMVALSSPSFKYIQDREAELIACVLISHPGAFPRLVERFVMGLFMLLQTGDTDFGLECSLVVLVTSWL